MVPIFPMVTKSEPETSTTTTRQTNEDQHESVDIIAPPPSACVLNESDHPLRQSPIKESSEVISAEEEKKAEQEEADSKPAPSMQLRKKPSFWDMFKPAISKQGIEQQQQQQQQQQQECNTNDNKGDEFVSGLETKLRELKDVDQNIIGGKSENIRSSNSHTRSKSDIGSALSQQSSRESNEQDCENEQTRPILRRQTSVMSFALNMPWAKRTRRLTDSTGYSTSSNAFQSSGIASRSNTFDSNIANENAINPSILCHIDDQNGHQIANDCVKFAHARHTIKTTKEIEILRKLASELEIAFRHQIDKVAILHSQLESVHWRQHDLQDENKHLRAQIGSLSEQIVNQQAQIEALRVTVKSLSAMMSPRPVNVDDEEGDLVHQEEDHHHQAATSPHENILQHYQENDSSHESTEASTPPVPKVESPKAIETECVLDKDETVIHQDVHHEGKEDDPVLFSAGILSANATQTFSNLQITV